MPENATPEELGAYVDETAKRVGLPIAPEHRRGSLRVTSCAHARVISSCPGLRLRD